MKLLLDTHVFLWWATEPEKLSPRAALLCADERNTLHISVASIWEMQIKADLGKLTLSCPLDALIQEQQQHNGLVVLPVLAHHVYALKQLAPIHKDPFDRLLIAQSKTEDMVLLSADGLFKHYDVAVMW
jgi:PIN domain nuclease of toxin-antitoxin system